MTDREDLRDVPERADFFIQKDFNDQIKSFPMIRDRLPDLRPSPTRLVGEHRLRFSNTFQNAPRQHRSLGHLEKLVFNRGTSAVDD